MLPIYLEITLVLLRRCLKVKKVPKIVAPHFPQDSYATQILLWAMLNYAANESLWLYCCSLSTLLVSGLLISQPSAGFLPPFPTPSPNFVRLLKKILSFPIKMLRKPRSVAFAQKHFAKSLIKQQKIFPIWEKVPRLPVVMLLSSQMNVWNVYYQASWRVKS